MFDVRFPEVLKKIKAQTKRVIAKNHWFTAAEDSLECTSELDRHGIVENGVDSAVDIDHGSGEHKEPEVQVFLGGDGVVHNHGTVGHPRGHKYKHDHCKHAHHLKI